MLVLPWHIRDRLADDLNATLPRDLSTIDAAPQIGGDVWADVIPLYIAVRDAVSRGPGRPIVFSGDCVTALAVLAAVQQRGGDPSLVWIDAHGDFHTEQTTASHYAGGLPLAKAVGRGDLTLPEALGLLPLDETRAVLVDGRDLDPPEADALNASRVRRVALGELQDALPDGPVHLHVDLDVIDPSLLPGLRFPAPGGAFHAALREAVRAVVANRPVAAVSIAGTWTMEQSLRDRNDAALGCVLAGLG
ncbi:MAG: arginase family protein [Candidatus Dormibacteraeota bacterium]|nr:arginase family protein [Candidatus Dormibacteraeota bacterium]